MPRFPRSVVGTNSMVALLSKAFAPTLNSCAEKRRIGSTGFSNLRLLSVHSR
jgi:hypothetical protein